MGASAREVHALGGRGGGGGSGAGSAVRVRLSRSDRKSRPRLLEDLPGQEKKILSYKYANKCIQTKHKVHK